MQRLGITEEDTEEGTEKLAGVPRTRSVGGVYGGGRRVTPTMGSGRGASGAGTLEVEKALPNGDIYCGEFAGNGPHGRGKYLWADGCMYEGEWRRGKAAGKGKFSWPSGATYEGEFKSGRMDGSGTFIGADGDTYRGSWNADRKHGYGSKSYANGDFFEGQWRKNLQEGQGRYVWRNGNQYVGEWRSGVICGRGVLIWANGNRFDGNWESGVPKGSGVFTWPDGSCYVGTWSNDLRSQQRLNGTFYPAMVAGRRSCSTLLGSSLSSSKKRPSDGIPGEKNLPRICIWDSDGEAGDITCDIFGTLEASMLYKNGDSIGSLRRQNPCNLSTFEVKKPGKAITKGDKNYDLMLNLQLGIRYSVGKSASTQPRELKQCDFDPKEKFWTRFPPEGSKTTPPHHSTEFRWKDYCPMVFRHLRTLFMVDTADYMLAICGNEALRELSSPGKSGSSFYLTQDDRFMIKTVKKSEVKVLVKMLSSYFKHVSKYRNTLVTKFFGLHCVKPMGGLKVRFIVMGNLFCSEYRIHRRFDLKGSSHGRTIQKSEEEIDENTTLKDLDLNFKFRLQKPWFKKLIWQIEQDCEFLEAEGIMDYSFLVGLHFGDDLSTSSKGSCTASSQGIPDSHESCQRHESMAEPCLSESMRRVTSKIINGRMQISLGTNMPARAEQVFHQGNCDHLHLHEGLMAGPNGGEIYEVILHFGIIDILRDYDISKRLEHAYKSLQVDPISISAVDPMLYSRRFRDFISRVFVEDD